MFKDATKTWQSKSRKGSTFIALYKHSVHIVFSWNPDEKLIMDFDDFLRSAEVFGTPEIHCGVIREIAANAPENLSAEAEMVCQFYKAYKSDADWTDSADIPETNFSAVFSPYGIMQFRKLAVEEICISMQCIHRFFFYGPLFSGIPLESRKKWKDRILLSMGEDSGQFREKGFILIDYDEISAFNYNHHDPLRDAGTFIELNKNGLTSGEWNGNQEHGDFYSLESCWYFGEKILSGWDSMYSKCKKIIEAAIIPENIS